MWYFSHMRRTFFFFKRYLKASFEPEMRNTNESTKERCQKKTLRYCRADLHTASPHCLLVQFTFQNNISYVAPRPYSIKGQVKFPQTYTHVERHTTHTNRRTHTHTAANPTTSRRPPPSRPDSTRMT